MTQGNESSGHVSFCDFCEPFTQSLNPLLYGNDTYMYHCQIFTRKCMLLKGTIVHHPLLCLVLCVELLYHVLHFAAAPLESLKTVLCSKMSGLHCSALLCQLCITMSISMQCAMNQSCMLCSVPKR